MRLRQQRLYCETVAQGLVNTIMDNAEDLDRHLAFNEYEEAEDGVATITKNIAHLLEAIQVCEKSKRIISTEDMYSLRDEEQEVIRRSRYPRGYIQRY
jgi:hypothetical protein